jgi:hypothetical protein
MINIYKDRIMKIRDLVETPLGDYKFIDTPAKKAKGHTAHTRRTAKSPEFVKKLENKLNAVNANFNIYFIDYDGFNMQDFYGGTEFDSFNDEYYIKTNMNAVNKALPKNITSQIKHSPNDITVLFVKNKRHKQLAKRYTDEQDSFKLSPWRVLHDIVHGMTLGINKEDMNSVYREFSNIETLLDRLYMKVDDQTSEESRELTILGLENSSDLMNAIGTMKSARTKYFSGRPEEFTTELMTQWLYSGDVKFNVIKDREGNPLPRTNEYLENVRQQCLQLFPHILKKSINGIYILSF